MYRKQCYADAVYGCCGGCLHALWLFGTRPWLARMWPRRFESQSPLESSGDGSLHLVSGVTHAALGVRSGHTTIPEGEEHRSLFCTHDAYMLPVVAVGAEVVLRDVAGEVRLTFS